jgi:hypothetical protein
MTLILRKLLASSTYAISGTLDGLARKLEAAEAAATAIDGPPEELSTDWENIDELSDEWDSEKGESPQQEISRLAPEQLADLRQEMARLREFHALAKPTRECARSILTLWLFRHLCTFPYVARVLARLTRRT